MTDDCAALPLGYRSNQRYGLDEQEQQQGSPKKSSIATAKRSSSPKAKHLRHKRQQVFSALLAEGHEEHTSGSSCLSDDGDSGCSLTGCSTCVNTTCHHRRSHSHENGLDSSSLRHMRSINLDSASGGGPGACSSGGYDTTSSSSHSHKIKHHHVHEHHREHDDSCCSSGGCSNNAAPAGKHAHALQADAGQGICDSGCGCEKLHVQLEQTIQRQHSAQQQHLTATSGLQHTLTELLRGGSVGPVTTRIHAAGICCPMESKLIHSILDGIPGVLTVDVTVVTKTVTVHHEPRFISPAALLAALNCAGLQASLTSRIGTQGAVGTPQQHSGIWQHVNVLQQQKNMPPLPVLCSGVLLLLSWLLMLPGVPQVALLQEGVLALIGAAVGIPPVARKAWAGLKNRNLDMNCLVVVALAGSVGLMEWFEAGALVFLFTLAEWLEERCVSRAAGALEDILRLQPETCLVIVEDKGQHTVGQGAAAGALDGNGCSKGCCGGAAANDQHDDSQQHEQQQQQNGMAAAADAGTCPDANVCSTACCSDHAAGAQHEHRHHSEHCHHSQHQHQQHHHHQPQQQQQGSEQHQCCADKTHSSKAAVQNSSCCEPAGGAKAGSSCATACCSINNRHAAEQQHSHHKHSHTHAEPQLLPMPVTQLQAGVLVLVRPGDKVPVDGDIEAGTSVLDESMVTGESKPVTKSVGQAVLAGTVNSGSKALRVRATAAAGNSTVARLASLMEAAAASKSKHDKAVEVFAKYYTPTVVLAALLTFVLGAALQAAEWRQWAYLSLVVLVTGCPCALVISTPVAYVAGLTRAARRGVLIKGGRYLELLGNLSAASFDKSGTLTEGHFQLTQLHTFGTCTPQQALLLAAALEQHSNHPIAHAIVGAAAARGCITAAATVGAVQGVTDVVETVGKGLQGQMQGRTVAIGSWVYVQEVLAQGKAGAAAAEGAADREVPEDQAGPDRSSHSLGKLAAQHPAGMEAVKQLMAAVDMGGSTAVCVVQGQQVAAVLLLSDKPRRDALQALQELQQLNVRCFMMTGDNMGAATHIAGQLGMEIEDVCAQLLPHDKLEMLGVIRRKLVREKGKQQRRQQQQKQSGGNGSWARRFGQLLTIFSNNGGSGSVCATCRPGECNCAIFIAPNSSTCASGSGLEGSPLPASGGVCIAHVGDGINDAPALAAADVGIAMGVAGTALAVDAADVALFSNNLTSLPFAIRLGRRAAWIVAANTLFACGMKVAVLAAAGAGIASLWLSLMADVGSSLLVTMHALTLLRFEAHCDEGSNKLGRLVSLKHWTSLEAGDADAVASALHGNNSSSGTWWRRVASALPVSSWFMQYERLDDQSAAASAATSRAASRRESLTGQGHAAHGSICAGGTAAAAAGEEVLLPRHRSSSGGESYYSSSSKQGGVELGALKHQQQLEHALHHHDHQHDHQHDHENDHHHSHSCCSHHVKEGASLPAAASPGKDVKCSAYSHGTGAAASTCRQHDAGIEQHLLPTSSNAPLATFVLDYDEC